MRNTDPALAHFNDHHPPDQPGTHVLIIGVGKYKYGRGTGPNPVAGDLRQLTSPPISARAIAGWFTGSFKNTKKPLVSVSLLISGEVSGSVPEATLDNVKSAARHWVDRLKSHRDNMAVFYFCGHGVSRGQQSALLLEDFGMPGAEYDGAIDVDELRGMMLNSPAIQQVYMLDCCRTKADDLYENVSRIGSRTVTLLWGKRLHTTPRQQFVLFPALDGETAFGVQDEVSVFSRSIIDAMNFAAADNRDGPWKTTTAGLLQAVDQLVRYRVPEGTADGSKPNAVDATSFDFNELEEPAFARSFVTISDKSFWGDVEFECVDPKGLLPNEKKHSRDSSREKCCVFTLREGRWRFKGLLPWSGPEIKEQDRNLRIPVAYVELEVDR
jgi:hypothetical protein